MSRSIFKKSNVYKPFDYSWADEYRKVSENSHWIVEEVDMTKDLEDFRMADEGTRQFIKNILSIFTESDHAVGNGYIGLMNEVRNSEIRGMLTSFAAREWIHQEGYAYLNESLGLPENYYSEFLKYPETVAKAEAAWFEGYDNIQHKLAKQVCLEGISLFGSFIMLKNFERLGKFLGTCKINEWSLKDETLHVQGLSRLFREICNERPETVNDGFKKEIYKMVRTIVNIEHSFIDFAFKGFSPEGLDKRDVKTYIEYIADRRLIQLGLKENYKIGENPLSWFDELTNGSSLQNFFEGRSADYDVAGLTGEWRY